MPQIAWYPYGKRPWYEHMADADRLIWEIYMTKHPDEFDTVAYDVAVGAGANFDTVVSPATGGDLKRLYQRRIDVLARKGGTTFIIELKPRASTSALGQVVGYNVLAARDFPGEKFGRPIVITDMLLPEMETLAKGFGVDLRVV